jgi:chorismate mutase
MIQALEKNLGDAKFHLANVQFQIMTMETERLRAAQKVAEAKQAMDELVRNTAKAHHIDPDDPAKGRWDLNTSNGVFTRVA